MSVLKGKPSTRSIWTGRISIGLVNVPVKAYTMIKDESFSFKYVRKEDACPLKYERICTLDKEVVPWSDVGQAVEVRKGEYVVFTKEEIDALRPESNKKISLRKFVPLSQVDRVFFDKSYVLVPDKSEDSYGLLLKAFKEKGLAGVGTFTLRIREYPVLVYHYRDSLVLTTLRYSDEVVDPRSYEDLAKVKEPTPEELKIALKIMENLTGDFDATEFKDTFKERVEELVEQKMKGKVIAVQKPKTEEVRELMSALRDTLAQQQQT